MKKNSQIKKKLKMTKMIVVQVITILMHLIITTNLKMIRFLLQLLKARAIYHTILQILPILLLFEVIKNILYE